MRLKSSSTVLGLKLIATAPAYSWSRQLFPVVLLLCMPGGEPVPPGGFLPGGKSTVVVIHNRQDKCPSLSFVSV